MYVATLSRAKWLANNIKIFMVALVLSIWCCWFDFNFKYFFPPVFAVISMRNSVNNTWFFKRWQIVVTSNAHGKFKCLVKAFNIMILTAQHHKQLSQLFLSEKSEKHLRYFCRLICGTESYFKKITFKKYWLNGSRFQLNNFLLRE